MDVLGFLIVQGSFHRTRNPLARLAGTRGLLAYLPNQCSKHQLSEYVIVWIAVDYVVFMGTLPFLFIS